ncbi:hypothetical protein PMJ10TS2_73960 [Paenibacillus melissococcoides]
MPALKLIEINQYTSHLFLTLTYVAYNDAFRFRLLELTVHFIRQLRVVTCSFVRFILSHRVRRKKGPVPS